MIDKSDGWVGIGVKTFIFILCMIGYVLVIGYLGLFVTDKICESADNFSKLCRLVDISEPHIPKG
ncbi:MULTISPECIES: hypothetical protein [Gibbsiella]|uniref:Uncharacterized protein n=1 Tax=Gibbsiella dentisursi TaxID=796890 RepID=A0ABP7KWR3_9GAMM|nr:hypothetical protein [Gibbsiella quercinecans]